MLLLACRPSCICYTWYCLKKDQSVCVCVQSLLCHAFRDMECLLSENGCISGLGKACGFDS